MALNINAAHKVVIAGGPSFSISHANAVEGYELIEVTIADGATDFVVQVLPPNAGLSFLLVNASTFSADLTYKLNVATEPEHSLDRPLLLAGAGATSLLDPPLESLLFANSTGADVMVQILAGRDATP